MRWDQSHAGAPVFSAVVATVLAMSTLTPLIDSPRWLVLAFLAVMAVASVGWCLQRMTRSRWLVMLGQLVASSVVLGWLCAGTTLWWGLPTWTTGQRLIDQCRAAGAEVVAGTAPLAASPNLTCALVAVTLGLGIVVHLVAIGYGAPAATGLPLFIPVAAAAANTTGGLSWLSFAAPAGGWLLLLGRDTSSSLARWSTSPALALTPTGTPRSEDQADTGFAARSLSLAIGGIVAALTCAAIIPHLPTRYLLDGLAEGINGSGNGAQVGYSSTLDVGRSLASADSSEVFRYRTTAQSAVPLRVIVATSYENGVWTRPTPTLGTTARSDVAASVQRSEQTVTVRANTLAAPALATPQPLVGADFKGAAWQIDQATADVYVETRPSDYATTYLALEITPALLRDGVDGIPGDDRLPSNRTVQQSLRLDLASADRIRALTAAVTRGTSNRYDAALAIQHWLRDEGGFSYSLELAAVIPGPTALDPISAFLDSRRGYCVQFASTMIMMARASGIPARMAIGFLPGIWQDGEYAVTSADAHSWPELYFPGAGWVRFEPTPGGNVGSPPAWSVPAATAAPTTAPGPSPSVNPSGSGQPTLPDDQGVEPVDGEGVTEVDVPWVERARLWLTDPWHVALTLLTLVLTGSLILPSTAAIRHRRGHPHGGSDAEREWQRLMSDLADLGVTAPEWGTVRQTANHIAAEERLPETTTNSLLTLVDAVERDRYARPTGGQGDRSGELRLAARHVWLTVARGKTWSRRLRAFLAPSVGRLWWREHAHRVTGRGQPDRRPEDGGRWRR